MKGVKQGDLIDCMGKVEMAAHLFRITQTEAKITNEAIRGQANCETAAFSVGRTVRNTMQSISGKSPESLPPAEHVKDVKKKLKGANKNFKAIDGGKKKLNGPDATSDSE